jgi:hypothetical protein
MKGALKRCRLMTVKRFSISISLGKASFTVGGLISSSLLGWMVDLTFNAIVKGWSSKEIRGLL